MRNDVDLVTNAAPSVCGDMLARGEADFALVPVIEYQRMSNVLVVPDVCVGSRERVRSVVLATRFSRLKDIQTIALDTSSRTSAVLIQIIFREFLGIAPECTPSSPDLDAMLSHSDAALIIGDPAMVSTSAVTLYDLAGLWHQYTGFGFVFAMWMARESVVGNVKLIDFAAARDEGLNHIQEIIDAYVSKLNLSRDELRRYLLENITFELSDDMRKGLDLYYSLANKHAFTSSTKPLSML